MTIARAAALLVSFAVIALGVLHLRGEQIRSAARIQHLIAEQDRLRNRSWSQQMTIAQLKRPDELRAGVERWRLTVEAPLPGPGGRVYTAIADRDADAKRRQRSH